MDLVLERTRHLVQTEDEKRESRSMELEAKAKGVFLKLSEGYIEPEDLPQILKESAGQDAPEAERIFLGLMIEQIRPEVDQSLLISGLTSLLGRTAEGLITDIRELSAEYTTKKQALIADALEHIMKELSEFGIGGPAVKPKYENNPYYETGLTIIAQDFENRLTNLKTEFKAKFL